MRATRKLNWIIGAGLCAFLVGVALLASLWTPYDPQSIDIPHKLLAPSSVHWFGTDHLGRDVLSMLMAGARNSLGVAGLAVTIGMGLGVPLGLWAASRGGIADELIMRTNDVVFAFPSLLLAILITAVWGAGALTAILAIGIFNVPVFARVTRGGALSLWRRDFILAAQVAGRSRTAISLQHVLPNLAGVLMVQATLQLSLGVLAEAGLSYLGLGAQPPQPSWGRMLNEAQTLTALSPTLALFPGLVILITVLALNLLGDALRDRADVRS
jgi:peptide/nickel transport system permease protein